MRNPCCSDGLCCQGWIHGKWLAGISQCQCSVSPNANKLRQSDLTSYFTVSDLWEALPNRDRTKFTGGTSILQYLNRDTSWRWCRAQPRGTTTQVLGRCRVIEQPLHGLSPAKTRGHKEHCPSGQAPLMLPYGELCPVHCPPSLHPEERLTCFLTRIWFTC